MTKIFVRILSYDDFFPSTVFGEELVWNEDWGAFILEKELQERPNIWKLVDTIHNFGFKFEQLEIIEDFWQDYDYLIYVTIEKS